MAPRRELMLLLSDDGKLIPLSEGSVLELPAGLRSASIRSLEGSSRHFAILSGAVLFSLLGVP